MLRPRGVLAPPELESLPLRESWRLGVSRALKASSPSPTQTDRLDWPQESPSTCPTARSRPRTAPGPQPLLNPAAITHTKTPCLCLCAWRQAASRGTVPEQGREGALAPNPLVPHAQPIFHGKAILLLFPGLNMGVRSAAQNAHPHRKEPHGAGAPHRGAQAARQKFALSPAGGGQAPPVPNSWPAPSPGLRDAGRSSTARSPLVQSTTCLGLHLVTGSMASGFAARWAGKSAAECCSLSPRLSPARPGRPLKPAWPRSSGPSRCGSARGARSRAP